MGIENIEHVILVIFENRSFDHVLGWMSHPRYGADPGIEGLVSPVEPATGELTDPRYENLAIGQRFRPFFLEKDARLSADLPHSRAEVATQMDHNAVTGTHAMAGFARSYYHKNPGMAGPYASQPDCLRMLAPTAAPVSAFLADNFCVCDHWFTPIPTDTHPNRCMALAGVTKIDSTHTLVPDVDTVFDWAEQRDIPWRVYSEEFPFLAIMRPGVLLDNHYRRFADFARDYQYDAEFPAITLLEPAYLDDPFASHPSCNHPPLPMGPGEAFLLRIYNAFFGTDRSRERFENTLLVVYYDEHGGFFDHVPPLALHTPCGALDHAWPDFETSGPRVPAIVVSPLVDKGVYKHNLDHTSVLRCLADRFTPDSPYSEAVDARHNQPARLHSLGDVVTRNAPRDVPAPPALGPFKAVSFAGSRSVRTPGEKAFRRARDKAHTDHHDTVAATHPYSFFVPR